MAPLATFALAAVIWVGAAAVCSLFVSAAWPALRHQAYRLDPVTRARTLGIVAIGPWLLPTLLVSLLFVPGVLAWLGGVEDHCRQHAEHPHLCIAHPTALLTPLLVGVLILAAFSLFTKLIWDGSNFVRMFEQARRLRAAAKDRLAADVRRIDSTRVFALTAGLLRPTIFVSQGLIDALPERQVGVVLEHERAHVQRRDPLLSFITIALSFPHWPSVRRALLHDLGLASEQACDEAAGSLVGDRLLVAETILAVERLAADCELGSALGFGGGSSVPERVHSLLSGRSALGSPKVVWWAAGLAVTVIIWSAEPLHHLAEHLLEVIRLAH